MNPELPQTALSPVTLIWAYLLALGLAALILGALAAILKLLRRRRRTPEDKEFQRRLSVTDHP